MPEQNGRVRQRDLFIVEARRNGTKTLQELADEYNISRERVRQIAAAHGVNGRRAAEAVMSHRHEERIGLAEENAEAIMMRYIAGDTPQQIGKTLEIPINVVKEILDEHVNDQVIAARSNFRAAQLYPHIGAGPRDDVEPREDRFWTKERCWDCLVQLARENGGNLMTSTQYQRISTGRTDLPSFKTVRDRLGRWSTVRVEVHAALYAQH